MFILLYFQTLLVMLIEEERIAVIFERNESMDSKT